MYESLKESRRSLGFFTSELRRENASNLASALEVFLGEIQAPNQISLPFSRSFKSSFLLEEVLALVSYFPMVENFFDLILDFAINKL